MVRDLITTRLPKIGNLLQTIDLRAVTGVLRAVADIRNTRTGKDLFAAMSK
jgi:hypothetical protein